jgi:hypothetical protein
MAGAHGYEPGHMDISQHRKTWSGFVRFTTWSLILIGILMVGMLIFRTNG